MDDSLDGTVSMDFVILLALVLGLLLKEGNASLLK